MEKVYTPFPPPPSIPSHPPPALSKDHADLQQKVAQHFSVPEYVLPRAENGALTEEEKFWLSYECTLRYLRASKWVLEKAIQRLEDTLLWRREFGVYDLVSAEHVEPEAVTGKEVIFGYDTSGRPGFYMFPSRQNTDDPTRQIQFVVWMLERCNDLMGPGVETIDLLINYADKSKGPTFTTSRAVLNILQSHYPERLGLSLILNVPFLLNAFYKLITPLIDPVTRAKMKFNPKVVEEGIFAPDMVMAEAWGGQCDFVYEHDKYWPVLVGTCAERKKKWMSTWRELGGTVGLKEWDYKGGVADQEPAEIAEGKVEGKVEDMVEGKVEDKIEGTVEDKVEDPGKVESIPVEH